jgi:hypothetical protein
MHSKLCKLGLGIEPVCLLFGKKANTDMNEDYGKIIEMELLPDVPWGIQLTMSKFYHTISEPETIWMIGDIDLLPLQKHHFITKITPYPDDHYLCLNNSGIAMPRCGRSDAFTALGSEVHGRQGGGIRWMWRGKNYFIFLLIFHKAKWRSLPNGITVE